MSKETVFLFDCDNTLTPPRLPMDAEFAERFGGWTDKNKFAIVSGGTLEQIREQIPDSILMNAMFVFSCGGNEVYEWARGLEPATMASYNDFAPMLVHKNEFEPSQKLLDYLQYELKYCNWPGKKFDKHFEFRSGMLNFSILGREADQQSREEYSKWNIQDGELTRLVNNLNNQFPDIEVVQGGQISVDIFPKGNDKGQILKYFDLDEYNFTFYGDKIHPNGNDYPLYLAIFNKECGTSIKVESWKETESLLGLTPKKKAKKKDGFPFAPEDV